MARIPHVWPPEDVPGPHVRLTNADKVLYPATGTSKEEVFGYYTRIAEFMLPHVVGRPATRKRWPNGVEKASFFEKQLAASAPDWLTRETVAHKSGVTTYPIIDSPAGMAWIAQQAALEVHVPQWRFVHGKPGPATRLVFDLDPGPGVAMTQIVDVAKEIRDMLSDIGFITYPVTSGSKGTSSVRASRETDQFARCSHVGQEGGPAARTGGPEAGDVDDDEKPSRRKGLRRLEPEQRVEDHDRAVLADGAGPNRRSRRRARGRNSTTPICGICASTRCSHASPRTATCWHRWTPTSPATTG